MWVWGGSYGCVGVCGDWSGGGAVFGGWVEAEAEWLLVGGIVGLARLIGGVGRGRGS